MRIERIEWEGAGTAALAARLRAAASSAPAAGDAVAEILARVRAGGDAAVRELAEQFGDPVGERLRVDPDAVAAAPGLLEPGLRDSLRISALNIAAVARAELALLERAASAELEQGQRVEVRSSPVEVAGVYVPGGRAAYPSSVLMCTIPARVAGVSRVVVATPPDVGGKPADAVLAACAIVGLDEVYAVGGAQAIAALAFGTESIPAVDVIAGPGNRFVTEAKRQVIGRVAIDSLAGPSELVVIADGTANPERSRRRGSARARARARRPGPALRRRRSAARQPGPRPAFRPHRAARRRARRRSAGCLRRARPERRGRARSTPDSRSRRRSRPARWARRGSRSRPDR